MIQPVTDINTTNQTDAKPWPLSLRVAFGLLIGCTIFILTVQSLYNGAPESLRDGMSGLGTLVMGVIFALPITLISLIVLSRKSLKLKLGYFLLLAIFLVGYPIFQKDRENSAKKDRINKIYDQIHSLKFCDKLANEGFELWKDCVTKYFNTPADYDICIRRDAKTHFLYQQQVDFCSQQRNKYTK